MEPIVKITNLSHQYATSWAIKDINMEFHKGGIYGLLGANGAGKSTTMNIICGVLKQTQGEVLIKGIDILKDPVNAKKNIGFLPQQAPLLTELSVIEYLTYCAKLRMISPSKVKPAVDEVMEKVGITNFGKRLISNLSGGYQQRVGIAQAIIHKPDLVVLDEPTNGLDPNQILEVRNLVREIAEERTVVLSTHILQEVQALCDDIWMINDGHVVFSGKMYEFDNYLAPTALLLTLASPPKISEIERIQGVTEVIAISNTRFKIHYIPEEDSIPRIVEASVINNWKLMEITPEKNSLDAVFAELSKKKRSQAK